MKRDRSIAVLGAGESGVGAAVLAKKSGLEVFVSDQGKITEEHKKVLSHYAIEWEDGQHTQARLLDAIEVIKSPGIPDSSPVVKKIIESGIPVISEIEFAARYTSAKLICVTGSNGKTTTAMLIHHILKNEGLNVGLAGNMGKSFARQVAENDREFWVLELSSFQLDGMFDFKADIAVLLNITPDHLDRYENSFEKYAESKFRITQNMGTKEVFIYNADDKTITNWLEQTKPAMKCIPFSIHTQQYEGAWLDNNENQIVITINEELKMSIYDLALQGKHNAYNSMAAGIAAKVLELRKEGIRDSLTDFQNAEHRLEFVARVNGIEYINDSKATNVNSTWYALESMEHPVVWIAGGVDKGNDYSVLSELVTDKVKAIVCLGKNNKKIIKAFKGVVAEIVETESAEDAVGLATRLANAGETVLLSPACASFDLFENYEKRGQAYKNAVKAL